MLRSKCAVCLGISFVICLSAWAAETAAIGGGPVTKAEAHDAIKRFRADRLSPEGRAAGALVREYAENSDDVAMTITAKQAPFLQNRILSKSDRALLLAAYIVGNVDSQFLHNEKKDDAYAGELEVIETYRQLQKATPDLHILEIDKLIDLEKQGELKKYLTTS